MPSCISSSFNLEPSIGYVKCSDAKALRTSSKSKKNEPDPHFIPSLPTMIVPVAHVCAMRGWNRVQASGSAVNAQWLLQLVVLQSYVFLRNSGTMDAIQSLHIKRATLAVFKWFATSPIFRNSPIAKVAAKFTNRGLAFDPDMDPLFRIQVCASSAFRTHRMAK
jgi:hypothetical protein